MHLWDAHYPCMGHETVRNIMDYSNTALFDCSS
jgi:hypothetical protein